MTAIFSEITRAERVVRLEDRAAGLEGVIVIHSTALGPAAGGCRFWRYGDADEILADALRLARGMSYKNAMAGLPFGGGKAVIRVPDGPFDRAKLFQAFGRAVAELDGLYVTAEDVGTTLADMQQVSRVTKHVAGLAVETGRAGGDPSPWTARGVFDAMGAAARLTFGMELSELTVAVQGTGNVGGNLCRLLAEAGARLIIADVDTVRRDRLATELGAQVVGTGEVVTAAADILAPCALGGTLSLESVPQIRAKLICGGANNQLATPDVANALLDRHIDYVPDYIANSGGIISVTAEYLGEDEESVAARVGQVGPRVAALMVKAASSDISPAVLADEAAESQIRTPNHQRQRTGHAF